MLVSVTAGNTDNKLTQKEWSEFVFALSSIIERCETQRHFFGGSATYDPWQTACFLFEIEESYPWIIDDLCDDLRQCRERYNQDSVCVLFGKPLFV